MVGEQRARHKGQREITGGKNEITGGNSLFTGGNFIFTGGNLPEVPRQSAHYPHEARSSPRYLAIIANIPPKCAE